MTTTRIRLMGRRGSDPYGVINAYLGENIAVAASTMPVLKLRGIAQAQAFVWNKHYHPDWDFRVEEKEV